MSQDEVLSRLSAAGEAYAKADHAREAALHKLLLAMGFARDARVPITEMSRLGHVSRVTAYRLLEKIADDGRPIVKPRSKEEAEAIEDALSDVNADPSHGVLVTRRWDRSSAARTSTVPPRCVMVRYI